jgi:hypothetical protein
MRVPDTVPIIETPVWAVGVVPPPPEPLSMQALRMSVNPARARDRTMMLCGMNVMGLPVETGEVTP